MVSFNKKSGGRLFQLIWWFSDGIRDPASSHLSMPSSACQPYLPPWSQDGCPAAGITQARAKGSCSPYTSSLRRRSSSAGFPLHLNCPQLDDMTTLRLITGKGVWNCGLNQSPSIPWGLVHCYWSKLVQGRRGACYLVNSSPGTLHRSPTKPLGVPTWLSSEPWRSHSVSVELLLILQSPA